MRFPGVHNGPTTVLGGLRPADPRLVADAVRALGAEHRRVLGECVVRGNDVRQAARHLGLPPELIKMRLCLALRALGLALAERGYSGDR